MNHVKCRQDQICEDFSAREINFKLIRKRGARKRSRITLEDSRRQRCQHLGKNEEWSLTKKGD